MNNFFKKILKLPYKKIALSKTMVYTTSFATVSYLSYMAIYKNSNAILSSQLGKSSKILTKILIQVQDTNTIDNKSWSQLHRAIFDDNIDLAKILIENGADINYSPEFKQAPLYYAVEQNNYELVKLLIESGANVNKRLYDHMIDRGTALSAAIRQNNLAMVKLLCDNGATIHINNNDNNNYDNSNCTIALAISWDCPNIALYLLDQYQDINETLGQTGAQKLFKLAVKKMNPTIVRYLLAENVNLNKTDSNGQNALFECTIDSADFHNKYLMAKFLIDNGIDVNCQDSTGSTPLSISMERSQFNRDVDYPFHLVKLLLENGADIDFRTIHAAMNLENSSIFLDNVKAEAFRILIENGLNIHDEYDEYGSNILTMIVKCCIWEIDIPLIRLLCDNGASIDDTLLSLSSVYIDEKIEMLQKHGIEINDDTLKKLRAD